MKQRGMHKEKTGVLIFQSTISRIVAVIIVLVLPINIMTLVLSNMVLDKNREQMERELQNVLDMNAVNLEDTLKRASRKMIHISFDENDFVELANPRTTMRAEERGSHVISAQQLLKDVKNEYPMVDLMYFHFPESDYTVMSGTPGYSADISRAVIEESASWEQISGFQWKMLNREGHNILVGYCSWNKVRFGMMLNLDRTVGRLNFPKSEESRLLFFTNSAETLFSEEGEAYFAREQKDFQELVDSSRYRIYTADLEAYDLRLVEVVERDRQLKNLPSVIVLLQILAVLTTLLVIPLLLWYINRQVRQPLNRLTKAIEHIEQGDLDYRIKTGKEGREFEQINHSFNDMMEQVKGLKIDVYEKELERKNIKMQYLSQQIQPHFILNAMNILYSYEPEEYPLIQKMVLCISKYFRYIVKANAYLVALSQEMEHIRNYFEIQKARYPGLFFSIVEYDERLEKALVPPLLVQNFAENAIKHSLKIGNKITIFVIAEYCEEEGSKTRLRIRLADTGVGMPDEILEKIRIFQETGEPQEGLGVGIQNSIERLKYFYQKGSSIRFWRDENYSGTNVEINLPLYFAKEGEEDGAYFTD